MKILFLDIDGVLNSREYINKIGYAFDDPANQIDPQAVIRLNRITDQTHAHIVVSSTWRYAFKHYPDKMGPFLKEYGITGQVAGITPELYYFTRAHEIKEWLDDKYFNFINPNDKFIILDDDHLGGSFLNDRLIKTNIDFGLQDEHVELAINMLGTDPIV